MVKKKQKLMGALSVGVETQKQTAERKNKIKRKRKQKIFRLLLLRQLY